MTLLFKDGPEALVLNVHELSCQSEVYLEDSVQVVEKVLILSDALLQSRVELGDQLVQKHLLLLSQLGRVPQLHSQVVFIQLFMLSVFNQELLRLRHQQSLKPVRSLLF